MNSFNSHQITEEVGKCSKGAGTVQKAEDVARPVCLLNICGISKRLLASVPCHRSLNLQWLLWAVWNRTGAWALKSYRCGFESWLSRSGRPSGKFLDLPESVSSSIKWDSYLWEVAVRVDRKNTQCSGPSSLCPHPILPALETRLCRALAEPRTSVSWLLPPGVLLGPSFPPLLLASLSPASFSKKPSLSSGECTQSVSPHPLSPSFQFHWFVVQITPVPEMLTWVDTFSSLLGVLVLGSGRYLINATHGTLGHKSCFVQAGVPAHEMTPLCG